MGARAKTENLTAGDVLSLYQEFNIEIARAVMAGFKTMESPDDPAGYRALDVFTIVWDGKLFDLSHPHSSHTNNCRTRLVTRCRR